MVLMNFKVWKDRKKEWRWTLYSRNGNKIAVSGEGYKKRAHALSMIRKILLLANPKIEVEPKGN